MKEGLPPPPQRRNLNRSEGEILCLFTIRLRGSDHMNRPRRGVGPRPRPVERGDPLLTHFFLTTPHVVVREPRQIRNQGTRQETRPNAPQIERLATEHRVPLRQEQFDRPPPLTQESGVRRIQVRHSERKARINYAEIPSHAARTDVLIRPLLLTYGDIITIGT